MPGSITPLPVLEEESSCRGIRDREPPESLIVRYGYLKLMAELPYDGTTAPLCGDKVVIRTDRGVEMATVMTSSCPGFSGPLAVNRKQVMEYIENSGGKDYPYVAKGKVLRIAGPDDFHEQAKIEARKPQLFDLVLRLIDELGLLMQMVDVEPLLGGERVVFYYTADDWVDFRELVKKLASELQTRIEMMQVNAREEARIVADYEKCGQHCCCRQFLKVLRPVSMRSAKIQKATLDPQKISGRCSRLLCCLRYEDRTYSELKKRLPGKKVLVETTNGIGLVLSTQILAQLVLVKVGNAAPVAYPLEEIRVLTNEEASQHRAEMAALEAGSADQMYTIPGTTVVLPDKEDQDTSKPDNRKRRRRRRKKPAGDNDGGSKSDQAGSEVGADQTQSTRQSSQQRSGDDQQSSGEVKKRRRRRRKRRRNKPGDDKGADSSGGSS